MAGIVGKLAAIFAAPCELARQHEATASSYREQIVRRTIAALLGAVTLAMGVSAAVAALSTPDSAQSTVQAGGQNRDW